MRTRDIGAASLASMVDLREKPNEPGRDYLRRVLGEFLRSDLSKLSYNLPSHHQDSSRVNFAF